MVITWLKWLLQKNNIAAFLSESGTFFRILRAPAGIRPILRIYFNNRR